AKRTYYELHMNEVKDVLADGETRARELAQSTMSDVHRVMNLG
ncbi:MAG TPA: tryptophan--tRNA ligase, partial [Bacteroidetes bacterium]|nr:tryptophan--tRNA ligase [Bacteroidota bacterium]